MPPKLNPLPQLIPNRVMHLRNLLSSTLWEDRQDLSVLMSPVLDEFLSIDLASGLTFTPIQSGHYFGEPDGEWQQAWFKVEIPEPSPTQLGRRFFFWDCRGETTVYIDGLPWAGIDVAHPYCLLPDRACTLWLDTGAYQTCIWYEGAKPIDQYGLRFDGAWLACRNLKNWETYWDLYVLSEWMKYLLKRDHLEDMIKGWGAVPAANNLHPVGRKLLELLDHALEAWEAGGVGLLAPALKRIFSAFPTENWQPNITIAGHSHLDLVWMWPEVVGERKAVHTIATALRLLDEYPQYRFLWTSPHSMKLVAERFPGLFTQIRSRILEQRWEANGAPWVEFDTLVACGEALGRSLVLGQRMFERLRGSTSPILSCPIVLVSMPFYRKS